jgi:hypothetical protein
VDGNGFEVAGGLTWCIGNTTLGNFTTRFPCLEGGPGDRQCVDARLSECNADAEYTLVSDCAAANQSCAETGPGTAVCQSPTQQE